MRLKKISYREYEGTAQEWRIEDLLLGPKNLLVGKNASGKSRSLNVISALATFLRGNAPLALSSNFDCLFQDGSDEYRYQLNITEQQVDSESFRKGGDLLLDRGEGGAGKIAFEKLGMMVDFQAPPTSVAAFVRRDSMQHAFLEHLSDWADSVRLYHFSNAPAKGRLTAFNPTAPRPDDRDELAVVALFREGEKDFPDVFKKSMIQDLAELDYPIDEIEIAPPVTIRVQAISPAAELYCLQVRESGMSAVVDQFSMSDGMFRVIALLVHVNLALLRKSATTILVDDIGEGLDFDRSVRLIELLRRKAAHSELQLIMSTNDRFVMNHVPLEEWTVLHRRGQVVDVRNYSNSKGHFDQFKFTGLSNFSFFEMNADGLSSVELDTDEDDEEGYDFPNRGA